MADRHHLNEEQRPRPYSVRELNQRVGWLLAERVPPLWVTGEISGLRAQRSGHLYFTLKDAHAAVRAVLWQSTRAKLPRELELRDGMELLVRGRVYLYEQAGIYQLEVLQLEERGTGRLQRQFLQLKARLEREGLFDPRRKKTLPALPRRVALVTSPTGAAVRDMIESILARCPRVELCVYPVRVQGAEAAGEIAEAIERLNLLRPDLDLLVVGRGGGSIEDLWAFNEETLARAIARSRIPVVSAVGHEVDTTIADLVADRSVPTPTAVGLVFPDLRELLRRLEQAAGRLRRAAEARLLALRTRLDRLAALRVLADPTTPLRRRAQRLDELAERAERAMRRALQARRERLAALAARRVLRDPLAPLAIRGERLARTAERLAAAGRREVERARARLERLAGKLEALSPVQVLARGYSVTLHRGRALRSPDEVQHGSLIETRLAAGYLESQVTRTWIQK